MRDAPSAEDVTEVLNQRHGLLREFTDGPVTQAELVERTDLSKATVYRAINSFEELHFVEPDDEAYRLTPFGSRVMDRHEAYLDGIEETCRRERFVSLVPEGLSLDSPMLEGAEVFLQDSYKTDAPSYSNKSIVENAHRVRTVLDGIMVSYLQGHLDPTRFNEQTVEVVLPSELARSVLDTYREELRELFGSGNFSLMETSRPVEYSTTIAETDDATYVLLLVHGGGGVLASARNESPEAIAEAEARYEQFRQDAEPIYLDDDWSAAETVR